ncbi:MAG: oligoendopeptidase F [Planctomycetes bacterium]|nr:oligoendopeptidase F [Planctomycetota bacterium]
MNEETAGHDRSLTPRSDIDPKLRWDLSVVYPDESAWEAEKTALLAEIPRLDRFRGRLDDPGRLREALDAVMAVHQRLERLGHYAARLRDEDLAASAPAAMTDQVTRLGAELRAALAYFDPEVLAIAEDRLRAWMADPRFCDYDRYLHDLLRHKPHVLGAAEEKVLANASVFAPVLYHTFSTLSDAELKRPAIPLEDGRTVTLTPANFRLLRQSPVRADRRRAFEALWTLYQDYCGTFSNLLGGQVAYHGFLARSRNHPSVLHLALHRNEIPVEFYDILLERVTEHLPSFHRYLRLRARLLRLEDDHRYHDIYPSLVPAVTSRYPVEACRKIALEAAAPLGEDYVARLRTALRPGSGYLDIYPNRGKRSGAYMAGCYGIHPLVLLNHNDDFESLSTLVHEMGHALHSVYSQAAQPYPKADYSIFVAEVASTLSEALLFEHLLEVETDPEARRFLLAEYLHGFRGTVFRQTMFAEFEREVYARADRREGLTGDDLNALYLALLRRYHGHDQGVMRIDELYAAEWAAIPHFYYRFYVYQYASSFIASTALAQQILTEGAVAARRYIDGLLGAGGAADPLTILRNAGVDLTAPEPYAIAFEKFDRAVAELEALAAERNA